MPEPTTFCAECGVSILEATAAKTGGKCMPCSRGTRAQIEEGKRWAAEQRERQRRNDEALARISTHGNPRLGDFLAEEDPIAVLWSFLTATVFHDSNGRENVEALTPSGTVLYFVQILNGEVLNGGFHQYFSNSSGRYAHETLAALLVLRAHRTAALLQSAIEGFPHRRVPPDHKERYDLLDTVNFETLDALDTEYYALEKEPGGEDLGELILSFMREHATDRIAA